MKARILAAARRVFGQYGYHGTTTRIIAKEVGIDISTLYYHWGEKKDLYEAVVLDIVENLRQELRRIEKIVRGRPMEDRMHISIDMTADYLFRHAEVSCLHIFRMFSKTREPMSWEDELQVSITDISRAMGLQEPDGSISLHSEMQVLSMMNTIHNFIGGRGVFQGGAESDPRGIRAHSQGNPEIHADSAVHGRKAHGGNEKREKNRKGGVVSHQV